MATMVRPRFGYDDSLDARGAHGPGGALMALKVADLLACVRISSERKAQGLDLSQHGEVGYDFES
jgi:ammonia channel protein AmtB